MAVVRLLTSESVTEGHPDKIADQISDAVLDEIIADDPSCKVACETLVNTGIIFIAGEITTDAYVDIPSIARQVVRDIGYTDSACGFDSDTCAVITSIDEQSPDIRLGVVDKLGAGDQGMMFGFACRDTTGLMPMPIFLAHRMAERLAHVRRNELGYLRPDGKTQVTVEYEGRTAKRVNTVVVSTQHEPDITVEQIREDVKKLVVDPTLQKYGLNGADQYKLFVNPTGRFVEGGPKADCGLTGRKIIVDTYGGLGSHGGGAFSGKDPSKVDRSGSYAARHIAKNIVAADLADSCEIQVAYAIGEREPVSIAVDTFGTGKVDDDVLTTAVRDLFDLTPQGIIERLQLKRPIYRKTAAYGHFGREDQDFPWEATDFVEALKKKAGVA